MAKIVGREIMESFIKFLPYLDEIFNYDIWAGVVDTEKYIAINRSDSIKLTIQVGDPIKADSGIHQAMQEKRVKSVNVPAELWGIPIKVLGIPIYDEDDKVIGGIAIVNSLDLEEKLNEIIGQFSAAFQQVNTTVQDISTGAENLAKVGHELAQFTQKTTTDVKRSDEIIE
ncbi:MAG: chemotaxis protein, partial [Clostridia bacterium]|nr:chemotaxis protein [Clostridia bacterium]